MNEISGARIVENREIARASRWLVLESEDLEPGWEPGHIAAIYIPDLTGAWIRHPYTVSRAEPGRLSFLFRVIRGGRITPQLAELPLGTTLRLGGRFGEPIRRLVPDGHVVGVSTGTGVGPLHGYAKEHVPAGRSMTILAGFREAEDVVFGAELTALGVDWRPVLSRPPADWGGLTGHVGEHLGVVGPGSRWHLVGNGLMIADIRAALLQVGVSADRITSETYFNRGASPDSESVAHIAAKLRERW